MFFPLAIIIIGAILLLENLNVISGNIWEWVWPALIIVLGLSMLLGRKRRRQLSDHFNPRPKPEERKQPSANQVEEAQYEEKK